VTLRDSPLLSLLTAHDWTYEYSDSHGVYTRGSEQRRIILNSIRTVADVALVLSFASRVPDTHRDAFIASVERAFVENNT
jgi:hypothetical protein